MGAPVATSSGARAASAQAGTGRLEIRMSLPLPLRVGPPRETADGFLAVVKAQIPERARRWLASALTATSAPLDRDGFETAGQPRLDGRPVVLAADPGAARAAADDPPVGGELEQDPGGDVLLASVRLAFGDFDGCPQAGDVGR